MTREEALRHSTPSPNRVKAALRYVEGTRILEAGCAGGGLTLEIAKRFPNALVTGVDCLAGSIALAKEERSHPNVTYLEGDVERLPFKQEFDCVVLTEVLEHVRNAGVVLDELNRVMLPNAALVVSVPSATAFRNVAMNSLAAQRQCARVWDAVRNSGTNFDHVASYDEVTLATALREAGFKYEKSIRAGDSIVMKARKQKAKVKK